MSSNQWYVIRALILFFFLVYAIIYQINAYSFCFSFHPPEIDFCRIDALVLEHELENQELSEGLPLPEEEQFVETKMSEQELRETYGSKCNWPDKYRN